ncbi:MAG: diadenylate cyclase CdaA [PVC group bacterium]
MIRLATAGIEVTILIILCYYFLVFIRATGAAQALKGIAVLALTFGLARLIHLDVLFSLFSRTFSYLFLSFVIIFAPELRRALAELGRRRIFSSVSIGDRVIDDVVKAVMELSRRKMGGLIALQRDIGLGVWVQSGVYLNSEIASKLLVSIFMPFGPLHDGGVVIQGDKIIAAACLFPFTRRSAFTEGLGMRHKAGLGLAEATDAVVIIVSEEKGTVSVAFRARLIRDVSEDELRKLLEENLHLKRR